MQNNIRDTKGANAKQKRQITGKLKRSSSGCAKGSLGKNKENSKYVK